MIAWLHSLKGNSSCKIMIRTCHLLFPKQQGSKSFYKLIELAVVLALQSEMSEPQEKDKHTDKVEEEEEEEEYVLLELDDCLFSDISPGAPVVLSGLDTLTPTLTVGDGLKMVGEYEETVGTCYLFSEREAQPKPATDEVAPSEENKDEPASSSSSKEPPSKEVDHLASVQKILKFRPMNADHQQHGAYQHKDKEI